MEILGSNVVQLAPAPRTHNWVRLRLLPRLDCLRGAWLENSLGQAIIGFDEVGILDAVF
jgi:hypothetical protein